MVSFQQLLDNLTVTTKFLEKIHANGAGLPVIEASRVRDLLTSNYQLLREAGYLLPAPIITIFHKSGC